MAGISMRELAELLGVSVASVSVALRGKPGISQETRERILAEAHRQGYDMNRLATPDTKGTIEIVDHTYYSHGDTLRDTFSYYSQFLDAVTASIARSGYTMAGPFNPAEPGFSVRPAADGSILLGAGITAEELAGYQKRNIPFVVAGNSLPDLPVNTVSHDNYYGIQAGISHLTELGHTRIGYIRSIDGPIGQERFMAYQYGMQLKGLVPADIMDTRPDPDSDMPSPPDHLMQRLDAWLKKGPPKATAYLCDNDFTAASLMRALRDHGYVPGKDVSVIGFDDQPFSALLEPPLTSIRTCEPELGTAALELLIYCLEHPGCRYRHIKIGTELIVRASTAVVK